MWSLVEHSTVTQGQGSMAKTVEIGNPNYSWVLWLKSPWNCVCVVYKVLLGRQGTPGGFIGVNFQLKLSTCVRTIVWLFYSLKGLCHWGSVYLLSRQPEWVFRHSCGLCAAMERKDTGRHRETHWLQRMIDAPKASGCAWHRAAVKPEIKLSNVLGKREH